MRLSLLGDRYFYVLVQNDENSTPELKIKESQILREQSTLLCPSGPS